MGVGMGKGSTDSKVSAEQSGIVFSSADHELTANNTKVVGGIIAHIETDENGNKTNAPLNFTTDTLEVKNLEDKRKTTQLSLGLNAGLSVSSSAKGSDTNLSSVGVKAGHSGHKYEATTLATIGQGAVVKSDATTGKNSLAGVNQDALNTTKVIKDYDTGGLAVDASIDTRVFTEEGRASIAQEQKDLGKNIQKVGDITGDAVHEGIKKGVEVFTDNPDTVKKVVNSIESGLSVLSIPNGSNYGGIYSEIPVLLGVDDIHQQPFLVAGAQSDKYKANPELFMKVENMPGYDDLPQQSKDKIAGMYISKEAITIDKNTATYQNPVNGMLNTKEQAVVNGLQQSFGNNINADNNSTIEFTLNFNNSKGILADVLEAGADTFAGLNFNGKRPFSWFNTGASDAAIQNVQDVINNTTKANFAMHSQGNLLINAGLPDLHINKTREELFNNSVYSYMTNNKVYNYTFNSYGSPVNNQDFNNGLSSQGLQLYSSTSNKGDPISEFVGGNYGLYHVDIPSQNNLDASTKSWYNPSRLADIVELPSFRNEKYDTKKDKNGEWEAQKMSPHSGYECAGKCGSDGSINPSLSDIQKSMNYAEEQNAIYKERVKSVKEINAKYNNEISNKP